MLKLMVKLRVIKNTSLVFVFLIIGCQKNDNLKFLKKLEVVQNSDTIFIPKDEYDLNDSTFGELVRLKENIIFDSRFDKNQGEPINYYRNKILQINGSINTLIAHPEFKTFIINFDSDGEFLDVLNMVHCSGKSYILNGEIICNTGYGYPYNSYKKYSITKNGRFEEIESYAPTPEKKIESKRFAYILDKLPLLKHKKAISLIPFDEEFIRENYPNYININNDISEFIEIFLQENEEIVKTRVIKLKSLLNLGEVTYLWLVFKLVASQHTVIVVQLSYGDSSDSFEDTIFLTYSKSGKLTDIIYNDYNEFEILDLKYVDNKIILKKAKKYGRDPEMIFEELYFDDKLGLFKLLPNVE